MAAPFEPKNYKVALLTGGISGEREVSLASGESAKRALDTAGFSVVVLDPADKKDLKALIDGDFDVAFIALHGKYGEDGTIQGLLEILGLPYIGSDVWASALSIDKTKAKAFYEQAAIQTPKSLTLSRSSQKAAQEILEEVGSRCVVKPATEGSALGVFIVDTPQALDEALQAALALDKNVLVEACISGREVTVAVLGNEEPYALPVVEIIPIHEFYDFESKYAPGGSRHVCPAPLDEHTTNQLQETAVKAHKILGCSGVSRSDFIIDEDGEIWILETNTIPGMTETSLLPDAARAANIEFPALCTLLVRYALEKAERVSGA
ncbi:MAG: D-alanine--D-alanine ligase [Coriobacteriaceae bacterium]|jgi:D-alanine-D-alanine ligase|nr:D-alanine--D-alanine ligase [Coriobacteriaceae bacterium]